MLKLMDLLKENGGVGFTTKKTGEEPEAGKTSWDVSYFTDYDSLYKDLSRTVREFEKAYEHNQDAELLKYMQALKTIRLKFARYISTLD